MEDRERGNAGSRERGETPVANRSSQTAPGARRPEPVISVIVPTYNERDSLPLLVSRLEDVGRALALEVVIVDDASPDGTGALAEEMARSAAVPVSVVHRSGKAGLASAVLEGATAARASVVTVIDADLSHPPELLPALLQAVRRGAGVAVASRYVRGGGVERWPLSRRLVSRAATLVARVWLGLKVRDPLSGFFAVRRELLTGSRYSARGYKLLVEILALHPGHSVVEVPYRFVDRQRGKSKLNTGEILAFLKLLWQLRFHGS